MARTATKTGIQQTEKSTTKEKLNSFKGKRENWLKSKRELTAYLNQIKNEQGIPVYYVIRDPEQEEKYRPLSKVGYTKVTPLPSSANTPSMDVRRGSRDLH
jgi:hypothetical protein